MYRKTAPQAKIFWVTDHRFITKITKKYDLRLTGVQSTDSGAPKSDSGATNSDWGAANSDSGAAAGLPDLTGVHP